MFIHGDPLTGRTKLRLRQSILEPMVEAKVPSTVLYLGGVYMTPGRLSPRGEFTPVPSHGSVFVYMIPPQNVMPARVTPA